MHENSELLKDPILQGLLHEELAEMLASQLSYVNYLREPVQLPSQPDRTFTSNNSIWNAILDERLRASITVKLEDFFLFEWFPRSPGLFYTPEAEYSRREALDYTISYPVTKDLSGIDHAALKSKSIYIPDHMRIFDPDGKLRMLHGGIGSVRLKDKNIDGERVWFMAASSTSVAHEGFPIAIHDHDYSKIIDQIATDGIVSCSLIGKLRFMPEQLETLYSDYTGVPQLYLLVDEIKKSNRKLDKSELPMVSVAATFSTEKFSGGGVFCSYVTFFPSQKGSFESRINWLEDIYVQSMYQGQIITDFDEGNRHFNSAKFSLEKVFKKQVSVPQAEEWMHEVHIYGGNTMMFFDGLATVHAEKVAQMNQEKVINIGDNNTITAPITIADSIQNSFNELKEANIEQDIEKLLEQLVTAVNDVNKNVKKEESDKAEAMARDVETLVKEATSENPRQAWYEITMNGLKEAAQSIGEIANPVLDVLTKLSPLLGFVL